MDHQKIKTLREKMGLTMQEAAAKADMPNRQYWHNIESGRRTNIKIRTLEKIASALGVPARDLLK